MNIDYGRIMNFLFWIFKEINRLMDEGTPAELERLAKVCEDAVDSYIYIERERK